MEYFFFSFLIKEHTREMDHTKPALSLVTTHQTIQIN